MRTRMMHAYVYVMHAYEYVMHAYMLSILRAYVHVFDAREFRLIVLLFGEDGHYHPLVRLMPVFLYNFEPYIYATSAQSPEKHMLCALLHTA